jgi:hypothetical protein
MVDARGRRGGGTARVAGLCIWDWLYDAGAKSLGANALARERRQALGFDEPSTRVIKLRLQLGEGLVSPIDGTHNRAGHLDPFVRR